MKISNFVWKICANKIIAIKIISNKIISFNQKNIAIILIGLGNHQHWQSFKFVQIDVSILLAKVVQIDTWYMEEGEEQIIIVFQVTESGKVFCTTHDKAKAYLLSNHNMIHSVSWGQHE